MESGSIFSGIGESSETFDELLTLSERLTEESFFSKFYIGDLFRVFCGVRDLSDLMSIRLSASIDCVDLFFAGHIFSFSLVV